MCSYAQYFSLFVQAWEDFKTGGVSNHWNGIWNGTVEWKMEWNSEHTQLQLTRVTGAAQSRLNYLVYI